MEIVCIQIILNSGLQQYLRDGGFISRPAAGSGVWMGFLLPTAIYLGMFKQDDTSELYLGSYSYVLAILLCTAASIFILSLSKFLNEYILSLILFVVVCAILKTFAYSGTMRCLTVSFAVFSSLHFGVLELMRRCPGSMTFGEAVIIMQSTILFVYSCIVNFQYRYFNVATECVDIVTLILQVGVLGIASICVTAYVCPRLRSPKLFYFLSAMVLVGIVVPVLQAFLRTNPVMWIAVLALGSWQMAGLVGYWMVCCVLAIAILFAQVNISEKASTGIRKYFHILAVFVFIPGLFVEYCFTYLASGVIFALFIVLELMRLVKLPPLGEALQEAFYAFADEKDSGDLALTPLCLCAGLCIPIWIHPVTAPLIPSQHLLALSSGILSVGVGDTAASIIGSKFGKHYWAGSKKTKEGTLSCIISQLIVAESLMIYGCFWNDVYQQMKLLLTVVITSLVEAKTDQIDNLSLPLITYILLI